MLNVSIAILVLGPVPQQAWGDESHRPQSTSRDHAGSSDRILPQKSAVTVPGSAIAAALQAGGRRWLRVAGTGYELISDAGPASATRAAERVERMQSLLGERSRVLPLRVVITTSGLFRELRPDGSASAFYQSGAEADWVVVQWGAPDSERALAHEMVHASLEHSAARRPLWLEEGLAEFYSTASRDGESWRIGQPINEHVRLLSNNEWIDANTLFGLQHDSPLRDERRRVGPFYAQGWAVVHYLLTAQNLRQKTVGFFEALGEGVPIGTACRERLGMSPEDLMGRARTATLARNFATAAVAGQRSPTARSPIETLTEEQASEQLLLLALAVGRPAVAAKLSMSAGPVARGLLALSQGERQNAERLFSEAVDAESSAATPYFELAMLLREERRDPARVDQLLRQALQRQPNLAEAQFLLGLAASARQDHESAIGYFQSAVQILPRHANFWHALSVELHRAGRIPEAHHAAQRCRTAARNQPEREMAAALEGLFATKTASVSKVGVHVPESWKGLRGNAFASGAFLYFDCETSPPQFRLTTPEGELRLKVARPGEIKIEGGNRLRHTFTCGEQSGAVHVQYLKETGELTAVEFLP